jgi:hypothetical protein
VARGNRRAAGATVLAQDFLPEEGGRSDRWDWASEREEGGQRTPSGLSQNGPWAASQTRPKAFPRPFILFLISFPFLF